MLVCVFSQVAAAQSNEIRVPRFDSSSRTRGLAGGWGGGIGVRWAPLRGPGFTIELRNHHISNAGTVGENLGVNAGTIVAGVQWILR